MPWWYKQSWSYCPTYHYQITGESSPLTNNKYFIMTNKEYKNVYFPFVFRNNNIIIYSYTDYLI